MDYLLHEGRITLPEGFQDRSVNMFIPGNVVPAPFSLTVARDTLLPDEALAAYVERQVGLLAAKLRKYKTHLSQDIQLGTQAPIKGVQVDAHYLNDGRPVYQRQAAFALSQERVLVFSATCHNRFDEHLDQLWAGVLASFRLHP